MAMAGREKISAETHAVFVFKEWQESIVFIIVVSFYQTQIVGFRVEFSRPMGRITHYVPAPDQQAGEEMRM
jgi:hypothetical protein